MEDACLKVSSGKRIRNCLWFTIIVFLYTLFVPFGLLWYIGARWCEYLFLLVLPLMFAGLVVLFLLPIVSLFGTFVDRKEIRKKEFITRLILSLLMMAFATTGAVYYAHYPLYVPISRGYQDRLRNKVTATNLAEIQAWLSTLKLSAKEAEATFPIDKEKWPECIKKLSPHYVCVLPSKNDHTLHISCYGGGFIGPAGLSIVSNTADVPASSRHTYIFPLEPKAFFWHVRD